MFVDMLRRDTGSMHSMHSRLLQHSLSVLCGISCVHACMMCMCVCATPTESIVYTPSQSLLTLSMQDVVNTAAILTGLVSEPHGVYCVPAA